VRARVRFNEVGTRDGFQAEPRFVPTERKIALIDALSACGFAKIEVTSFVSPKAIPMLRDADEVMRGIRRAPGVLYAALVPNLRGAERAVDAGADELNLVMSASESHNRSNLRCSREDSYARIREVAHGVGQRIRLQVSLSTAFGCPYEGGVPLPALLDWVERLSGLGIQGITLCDTTGMAHPVQVRETVEAVRGRHPALPLTLHFHNTRGMGLANILAGVQAGVDSFDGSLGGLGGCPYAPGATGNVCTEDAVHMLHCMGHPTGIDLDRLLAIAGELPGLVGHEVPGQVLKAGRLSLSQTV